MVTATVAIPPEAQKRTEAGAKAFARFFWESASATFVSNDVSPLRGLMSPNCHVCSLFTTATREERAKGRHLEASTYDIQLVRIIQGSGDMFTVSVAGNERVVKTLDQSGSVVERTKPGVFSWATQLSWSGRWQVQTFKAES